MVVPSSCGSGRPVGWLDTKSDSCVVDENMLDTEMSPIVSVRLGRRSCRLRLRCFPLLF